jgi:hypothetical protein
MRDTNESLNNLIPRDVFYGKDKEIITRRDRIKKRTLELRMKTNLKNNHQIQLNNNIEYVKTIS